MKKYLQLACMAVALAFAACTNEVTEPQELQPTADEVLFVARNFTPADGKQSRTTLTPSENGVSIAWAEGDEVGILPDEGSQVAFVINDITNGQNATFTGGAWGLKRENNYAAYYPLIEELKMDRTKMPVDYTSQTSSVGNDGTVSLSDDYMAAQSVAPETGNLKFEFSHLGALVEVKFTMPDDASGNVTKLYITASEPTFPVEGTFDLSQSPVALTMDEDNKANSIVVDVEGLAVQAGETMSVFLMMPPMSSVSPESWTANVVYGDNLSLPLTLKSMEGKSYTQFEAQKYYTLEATAIQAPERIEISDVYSLSSAINIALGELGGTKLRFVTSSTVESETVVYTDNTETQFAYAVRNGDWLEVHTLAKSFKLSGEVISMFDRNHYSNFPNLTALDLSGFDTADVTNMCSMFSGCSSLTTLDLSSFNTGQVTDMSNMFYCCSSLTTLNLSSFNTANVTNMSFMFDTCSSLTSLDLSSFNTEQVTNMCNMFGSCLSLATLTWGDNFNTANVTNMNYMFNGCSSLTALDLSGFNTSKVTTMHCMFGDCSSLTTLDLSSFDTSAVTDDVENYVYGIAYMFNNCSSLTSLTLGEKFNPANVTSLEAMFSGCASLTSLNLSKFNPANVTDMDNMFYNCSSLTTLDLTSFTFVAEGSYDSMFYNVGFNSYNSETGKKNAKIYVSEAGYGVLYYIEHLGLDYAELWMLGGGGTEE